MTPKPRSEITGTHVFYMMCAFFGVIFAANAIMVYLAVGSFTGEHERNAYEHGLSYNEVLKRRAETQDIGWTFDVAFNKEGNRLMLLMRGRDGAPVTGLSLEGDLMRPVQANMDRKLTFSELPGGRYIAPVENLAPGQWDLKIETVTKTGLAFEASRRL